MRIPSHLLVELCSMTRSLSTMLFKGVGTFRTSSSLQPTVASGSLLSCHGLRYSTISDDSDTHEDCKPANKLDLSVQDVVEKDVKENPIIIYMKGIPDAPRCGFSDLKNMQLANIPSNFHQRRVRWRLRYYSQHASDGRTQAKIGRLWCWEQPIKSYLRTYFEASSSMLNLWGAWSRPFLENKNALKLSLGKK